MRSRNLQTLLVAGLLLARPGAAQDEPVPVALPSNPLTFVGIQPCRMADTRAASGFPSGYGAPALGAAAPRNFALTGRCGIPTSALAVSANVTVVGPAGAGFLGIAPQDGPAATVATLNYVAGQTVGNAAVIALGTNGGARFISVAPTDLVIDVNGYYTEKAPGPTSASINRLQIATLHWYEVAQNGLDSESFSGYFPAGAVFDGANIWWADPCGGLVTKRRASDGTLIGGSGGIRVGCKPVGLAFDGANIWVPNRDFSGGTVSKRRASDGASLGDFPIGAADPAAVAFDGASIWVAIGGSNSVSKLRASDGAFQGTFPVGTDPESLAFDGTSIWVANLGSNNVTRLRPSDGAVQGTSAVGTGPAAIAFDGTSIWVANLGSNSVTKLRASDGAAQGTFAVGAGPRGVAFDGANVWVANSLSNDVTKLRASDGAFLGNFAAGFKPCAVVFDGAFIWVAGDRLSKL